MSNTKSPKTRMPKGDKEVSREKVTRKRKADDDELVSNVYNFVKEIGIALHEVEVTYSAISDNGTSNVDELRSVLKAIKRGRMFIDNAQKLCPTIRSKAWMIGFRRQIANAAEKFDETFDNIIDAMEI